MKLTFYILLLLLINQSSSQTTKKEETLKKISPILFEPVISYLNDSSYVELFIIYRVKSKFFSFSKKSNEGQDVYSASGDLIFEILNEKDIAIGREYKQIQINRNNPVDEKVKIEDIQGYFRFKLKPDTYRIVTEIKDNESNRTIIDKNYRIEINTFNQSKPIITSLIFIEPLKLDKSINESSLSLTPIIQGGNVLIGQSCNALFQYFSSDTINKLQLNWTISGKADDETESTKVKTNSSFFELNGYLSIHDNLSTPSFYIKKDNIFSRVIILQLPIEKLESGKYTIFVTIKQGVKTEKKETSFDVIWPSKPKSLSNIRLAIDALKHIATEEELKQISSFSITKAKRAFNEFWKKRSPDTTRAFNPTMAEYYRRVDEAILKFSRENENDGYLTDRGKIFILFGSPTRTNRLLRPNTVPTEIWTYENLRRRFIFKDEKKTGSYILVRTEEY